MRGLNPSPDSGGGAPDAAGDTGSVDIGPDASAPITMTTVTRAGDPVANVTLASPIGIVETAGPPTAPPLPQDGTLRLTAWSGSN